MTLLTHTEPALYIAHLSEIRSIATAHDCRWFHGSDDPQHGFASDPAHPGIWTANSLLAALWYTQKPGQDSASLHLVRGPHRLPSLNATQTMRELCEEACVPYREARRDHEKGTLYLTHQRALCDAAQRLGYPGLLMRDHTRSRHLSAVYWTRMPRVITRVIITRQRIHQLPPTPTRVLHAAD